MFIGLIFFSVKMKSKNTINEASNKTTIVDTVAQKLLHQVRLIQELVQKNPKYNKEIAFLVDMNIMSGKNRFFVYDLKTNKIIDQGLVAHGVGSGVVVSPLKFSNQPNSYCTSLGKYCIGKSYMGTYGKAYKLYGLDETNSNAYSRNIVLHKYDKVPYEEQGQPICFSLGCPMLNEVYYKRIDQLIAKSNPNIILSIYY